MASRQEITRQLAKLVSDIPAMRRRHPDPTDFIETLAGHADSIVEDANDSDADWACAQADVLLEKHRDRSNE